MIGLLGALLGLAVWAIAHGGRVATARVPAIIAARKDRRL